jgi:predicted nucleotidyltransferase
MKLLKCTRKRLDPTWVIGESRRIAKTIVEVTKPRTLYLFGSAVEGKMTDQSDFDLLSIYEDSPSLRCAQKALLPYYPLSNYPVDIVWVTKERFEKMSGIGGVCMVAYEEGRCLYSEGAFL